ncbi:MAG TPA: hypothetical protein VF334_08070 [Polyangia bacterium]
MRRATLCLAALALAGCFDFDALRQPRDGGSGGDDLASAEADLASAPDLAGADAGPSAPTPRLIAQAWFSDASGTTYASTVGMKKTGFEIPTAGIVDGDLVLFIASIDNGSNTVWPNPIAPGFTQIAQAFYGSDGETFVAAYKIANGEPPKYTGTYGPGIGSGSSAIALIAVSGANKVMPIDNSLASFSSAAGMSPVNGSSTGLVTTAAGCTLLLASGVDWLGAFGSNTFTLPGGFTSLSQLGDHGTLAWDWTSQQVSWAIQANAGATGALDWSAMGSQNGQSWTVLIAVAP